MHKGNLHLQGGLPSRIRKRRKTQWKSAQQAEPWPPAFPGHLPELTPHQPHSFVFSCKGDLGCGLGPVTKIVIFPEYVAWL